MSHVIVGRKNRRHEASGGRSFLPSIAKNVISGTPLNGRYRSRTDGALYFVTGGRGTAGNVYRVAWKGQKFDENALGTGIDRDSPTADQQQLVPATRGEDSAANRQ